MVGNDLILGPNETLLMPFFKSKYRKFSDEKLMGCIQGGDTSAFNELYDRYSKRLLFYFFRELGGDEAKAQDFLQEIFLKIVEKPGLFRTERKFSTWIFTVAYNLCKNEYRRMQIRSIVQNEPFLDEVTPSYDMDNHHSEQSVDANIFKNALSAELGKIDTIQRSVFVMRYQQNLSIKEISNVLNTSEGTIKSRLFYTTRKLANRLKAFNPNLVEV